MSYIWILVDCKQMPLEKKTVRNMVTYPPLYFRDIFDEALGDKEMREAIFDSETDHCGSSLQRIL